MDRPAHRSVGWSILWNLAVAQLRQGRSVVLDGSPASPRSTARAARPPTAERDASSPSPAAAHVAVHRARIEGRVRGIPGWHELDWDHVSGFVARWEPPPGDLCLDAVDPLADNVGALDVVLRAG